SAGASPCCSASPSSNAGSVRFGLAAIGAVSSSARTQALVGERPARSLAVTCTFMVNASHSLSRRVDRRQLREVLWNAPFVASVEANHARSRLIGKVSVLDSQRIN